MSDKPVIAATIGDPCGIGPEVCVKALATGEVHELCRPLLIGSTEAVEDAVRFTGVNLGVRRVTEVNGAGSDLSVIDVYDTGELDPADITPAQANATCGKASVTWLNQAHEKTERGLVNGTSASKASSRPRIERSGSVIVFTSAAGRARRASRRPSG